MGRRRTCATSDYRDAPGLGATTDTPMKVIIAASTHGSIITYTLGLVRLRAYCIIGPVTRSASPPVISLPRTSDPASGVGIPKSPSFAILAQALVLEFKLFSNPPTTPTPPTC